MRLFFQSKANIECFYKIAYAINTPAPAMGWILRTAKTTLVFFYKNDNYYLGKNNPLLKWKDITLLTKYFRTLVTQKLYWKKEIMNAAALLDVIFQNRIWMKGVLSIANLKPAT